MTVLLTWWNMWPSGRSENMRRDTRSASRSRMSAQVDGLAKGRPAAQPPEQVGLAAVSQQ